MLWCETSRILVISWPHTFVRIGAAIVLLGVVQLPFVVPASGADSPEPKSKNVFDAHAEGIIAHLNTAISWYGQVQAGNDWLLQPGDAFYWNNQRTLASQTVNNVFASARAIETLIAHQTLATAKESDREARLSARISSHKEQLEKLQHQRTELDTEIRRSTSSDRASLLARRDVLQAEIDLFSVLVESLQKASTLLIDPALENNTTSLSGRITALQRSVPELFGADQETQNKNQPPSHTNALYSEGILNRATALFFLIRSRHEMNKLGRRTGELQSGADRIASGLSSALRNLVKDSESDATKAEQIADPNQLAALRTQLVNSSIQIQDLSAALLPLRQEVAALGQTRNNLEEWERSFASQADTILRTLFLRAVSVIAVLILVLVISEAWRRASLKYIQDLRRRRQILLIRRFVVGSLVSIIVLIGFISDFGSIATFAGFLTAGIAVALQTVILSMAAYFFLIGRYGVKVGDRVTVSGVTGDVIDVGVVRVFLLELAGTGVNLHPTGRIVVMANSALFSAVPFFKQLPGTEYAWHELSVGVSPDSDTALVQHNLLTAVNTIYNTYRNDLERQHNAVEQMLDLRIDLPVPISQLRFSDSGMEVEIRYPVELHRLSEIDGLVTEQVLSAIVADDVLKKSLVGSPRIRAAVKG